MKRNLQTSAYRRCAFEEFIEIFIDAFDMRSNCKIPLIEAIDQIFTLARLHKYNIDLHQGNTMQRLGQELPVIIDPLFDMKTDTSDIVYEMRKRGE